jgi:hypothetical protein
MGRGMIPGPIWKRSCIILFIIYMYFKHFNMSNNMGILSWEAEYGYFPWSVFIWRQWRHVCYVPKSSITFRRFFSVYNRMCNTRDVTTTLICVKVVPAGKKWYFTCEIPELYYSFYHIHVLQTFQYEQQYGDSFMRGWIWIFSLVGKIWVSNFRS